MASFGSAVAARAVLAGVVVCWAGALLAQDAPFSFASNGALSKRPFTADEVLVVTVMSMQPGEEIWLQRCGNARCSVGSPVAKWKFEDFASRSASEVPTEGDRYGFYLYNFGNRNKGTAGASVSVEGGATILRFESGTSLRVAIRGAR
jgi:hypothetical protein